MNAYRVFLVKELDKHFQDKFKAEEHFKKLSYKYPHLPITIDYGEVSI